MFPPVSPRDIPAAALATVRRWNAVEFGAMVAFLFWVVCGLSFAPFRVQPSDAYRLSWLSWTPWFIQHFVYLCLLWGDVVLIILAAVNTHFAAVRQWGRAEAVKWGVIVMVVSGILETVGTLTTYPFGPYVYTDAFGPRIGGILPITIPLAWLIVMTNFLILVRQFIPFASARVQAVSVAVLATMFDFVLEPFAVYIKQYWIWLRSANDLPIPLTNYFSWWGIAFLLTLLAAPQVTLRWGDTEPRSALIIVCMLAIFIVTRLAHGI
ncbi:MAG: carotenoid biosynthesis protein [Candidatus Methylacidiphilales bacterium]|nr:carotenoid biosynthesis protein [Candidatus Methylacidiphilales bacterium]